MLRENEQEHESIIDFLTDACKTFKKMQTVDGKEVITPMIDPKRVFYKTHNINSNYFARNVLELEQMENLAEQAEYHMSKPRAEVIKQQILDWCASYKYSYDAKNSESRFDKNNSQLSLLAMLNKSKQEKVLTVKGEAKKTFLDSLLGREGEKESDRE